MTVESAAVPPGAPAPRKPRKIFLLIGVVVAIGLGIGLFTSIGTNKTTGAPHVGGAVPTFSASRVNGSGSVSLADDASGSPTVVLFFGKWCHICHTELPALAAAVRAQEAAGGTLSHVRVIGVDNEDTLSNAKSFVASSGVTFPVAYDPNLSITSGNFYFEGDPHAVFVNGNGTINRLVGGQISPAAFTADERALKN